MCHAICEESGTVLPENQNWLQAGRWQLNRPEVVHIGLGMSVLSSSALMYGAEIRLIFYYSERIVGRENLQHEDELINGALDTPAQASIETS